MRIINKLILLPIIILIGCSKEDIPTPIETVNVEATFTGYKVNPIAKNLVLNIGKIPPF